ncbi:MAG: DnaJ domain-containing protein [Deltaproteobacteria bacterium]|nr:DnaJ domain-containing protein [Deltaproteobacteria bacterium]
MICWRCRERVEGTVCAGCGAVQPPPRDPDLYAVLGLPRRFHLEPTEIETAWKARSRQVHPDRHVGATAVERRMALQWTATLNEARRVLGDPLRRAAYLATGRTAVGERGGPPPDPDFLDRVFEWRSRAEAGDPSVSGEAAALRAVLVDRLEGVFRAWEDGGGELSEVESILARIRFLEGFPPPEPG